MSRLLLLIGVVCLLVSGSGMVWAADTDGDGLEDEWELSYFVSLNSQDGAGDPDLDTLTNEEEETLGTDPTREDTDGDSLTDAEELNSPYALDPTSLDTDGDFLLDGEEVALGTDPTNGDTDSDGLTDFIEVQKGFDPLEGDSDSGGVWDGEEVLVDQTDPEDATDDLMDSDNDGITNYFESQGGTNPFVSDTDADWLADGDEDANQDGVWDDGETNPTNPDTDGDGLHDGWEVLVYETDPFVQDTDGDGLTDGEEHTYKFGLYACLSPLFDDSDRDGLGDQEEVDGNVSDPCMPDSDNDGLYDISEVYDGTIATDPNDKALDTDGDGLSDLFETDVSGTDSTMEDTDGDGLSDAEEWIPLVDGMITDPNDADTDDDGILDGNEGGVLSETGVLLYGSSPLKWDTDQDGLSDGLETGLVSPQQSVVDPGATDFALFVADTDPLTTTSPRDADSDDDGLKDGVEDANHNGFKDADETDPNLFDTDGDSIDDGWETQYSTDEACPDAPLGPLDPLDPSDKGLDNDGDGLSNFKEYTLVKWEGGEAVKNSTNPCLWDTDGDALRDGLEVYGNYGVPTPSGAGSDPNMADTDGDGLSDGQEDANMSGTWSPLVETNPVKKDTDGDGLLDGAEDSNKNGVVDPGETDPTNPDTDADGLNDGTEFNLLGTDPLKPDTDDDGLLDGLEVAGLGDGCPQTRTSPHLADTDGDGLTDGAEDANHNGCYEPGLGETDPLNPDSDGDKLSDGLEVGALGDTDPASTTNPLSKDTDGDGLWDSHEDKNKNGAVDEGESDPNLLDTDEGGVPDGTEVLVDDTDPTNPLDDNTADPDGDGIVNGDEKKIGTDPYNADTDGDFIPDPVEVGDDLENPVDTNNDNQIDALDQDSDGDGIPDSIEAGDTDLATPPVDSDSDDTPDYQDSDSDGDTIPDNVEWGVDSDNDGVANPDADLDDQYNYLDLDSDNDGKDDVDEGTGDQDNDGIPNFVDPNDADGPEMDSDGDGLKNTQEVELGTDPFNPDTDGDGLNDFEEVEGGSDPLDLDSDDDGLDDSTDGLDDGDFDGLIHALDPDSDDDGIFDGTEEGVTEPLEGFSYTSAHETTFEIAGTDVTKGNFVADLDPLLVTDHTDADSDDDGTDDGMEDPNHNGKIEDGEGDSLNPDIPVPGDESYTALLLDSDLDGLSDIEETEAGTDPLDGDSDDDGIADGTEHNWRNDTDLDGAINALDADSDNDGLADGLEEGLVDPEIPSDTSLRYSNFSADTEPESTTYALIWGSALDGIRDGALDPNHDGASTLDEDPGTDSDNDGLSDVEEVASGSNPDDADSDDDGILDSAEANFSVDFDKDGLRGAVDPDSDNDGLLDGTEMGLEEPTAADATDLTKGNFLGDSDPLTRTWVLRRDSDGGGQSDGSEDTNKNGNLDAGESDPTVGSDDWAQCQDSDEDGLCNEEEALLGTDPADIDSDDDGLADGLEQHYNLDTDGDGEINALDPDSDSDLLPDGLEMGVTQPIDPATWLGDGDVEGILGTDLAEDLFASDKDPQSLTFMLIGDTDGGGVVDGLEDINHDGEFQLGETDPNDPVDDGGVSDDIDGDTLTNDEEVELGTDPYNKDTDGDTIPDNVEVGSSIYDPLDSDSDGTIDALDTDSDDDTLLDSQEAGDDNLNTPPVDTDGDGTPDYRDTDSDDDELLDDDEVNVYGTSPILADTDGGGADDYLETQVHFSDPHDPEDDFVGWLEDGARIQGGAGCTVSATPSWHVNLLLFLLIGFLLLFRRFGFLVLVMALTVAVGPEARADYHPDAKFTDLDANPFRLDPDGNAIASVQTDRLPKHLEWRVGLSLHYIDSPIAVVKDGTVLRELVKYRAEMQLSAVLGLWDFLEVGTHLPLTLYQDAQYAGYKLGSVDSFGLGNASLFVKVSPLQSHRNDIGLALYLPLILPTHTGSGYTGTAGVAFSPTLVVSKRLEWFLTSLNVGYQLQSRHTLFHIVDDDKLFAGAGLAWAPLDSPLEVGAEVTTFARADAPFANSEEWGLEADVVAKYRIGPFRVSLGGGKGLASGYSTPNFRVFGQVMFAQVPDPDRDHDGILNEQDKCPDEAEDFDQFEDEDGCPDLDNDGDNILDANDQCRDDPEDMDRFEDEDGCPDLDNDQDGVPDELDRCPLDKEDIDKFQDEDGCPDPDNDQDGIPDVTDKCPMEKEVVNGYKDEDGCPDKKLAELENEARRIKINEKIHFGFMSAEIQDQSFEMLDQIALILVENPQILLVQVEGHTDKTGTSAFNMRLSLARARAVVDYLVKKGVGRKRLDAKGYGDSRRIDYRSGPEANFTNRRVEFNVMKYAEPAAPPK